MKVLVDEFRDGVKRLAEKENVVAEEETGNENE